MNYKISKIKAFLLIASFAMVNRFIVGGLLGTIGFNIGRVMLAAWGGWYLFVKAKSNLWFAALVGIIIMTVDHIFIRGGFYLLAQLFRPELVQNEGVTGFYGVLISFVMFAPFAALISLGGGFVGRKNQRLANKSLRRSGWKSKRW